MTLLEGKLGGFFLHKLFIGVFKSNFKSWGKVQLSEEKLAAYPPRVSRGKKVLLTPFGGVILIYLVLFSLKLFRCLNFELFHLKPNVISSSSPKYF